jgi:hypothetical protein
MDNILATASHNGPIVFDRRFFTELFEKPGADEVPKVKEYLARRKAKKELFVVAPDRPKIKLPSYFKGLEPLTYGTREDDSNFVAATGTVANKIQEQLQRLEEDIFRSDLPTVGLAYGYFNNFVLPLYNALRERECIQFSDEKRRWKLDDGFCITIAMPETIMNRDSVDQLLLAQFRCTKAIATLQDGRDFSVYLLPIMENHSPLAIIDVPTTLLTCGEVIERVDSFWVPVIANSKKYSLGAKLLPLSESCAV